MSQLFIQITDKKSGEAVLYLLEPLEPDKRVAVRAWRLWKEEEFYDVAIDGKGLVSCTCEDATYRHRPCKHLAALKEFGLL
mgnify:CR=1 FL=1